MQLTRKSPGPVRRKLSAAVLTLLGASVVYADTGSTDNKPDLGALRVDPSLLRPDPPPRKIAVDEATYSPPSRPVDIPPAHVPGTDGPWTVDTGVLYYKEGDDRIQTTEAVVNVKRIYSDDSSVNLKLTIDSLTGGSPNGALPSQSPQTFSSPSGTTLQPPVASATPGTPVTYTTASGQTVTVGSNGSTPQSTLYAVAPGALPIDKSFHDQRLALGVGGEQPWGSSNRLSYGGALSHELDFLSLSGNAAIAHDLAGKNTTLSAGINLEDDSIRPIGGAPVAWSNYSSFQKEGNKTKHVGDLLFGVTQIMSRRWITQLNYSLDRSSGYQNDPYKIISVLDAQGNLVPDSNGNPTYLYENRPANRSRRSLYWDNKFAFDHDVLQVSLRRMSDDWGITSNTVDVHYRWTLADGAYLEPHLRRYNQTAASFFRYFLNQGDPSLTYASADPRLAKFDASTIGLKFAVPTGSSSEINLRLERYVQKGNGPDSVPVQLQGLNLYPGLKAWILQGGLRFQF